MGLLKKISSLILLIAFSFQCFNKAFIVVDYYSNTTQYAKVCINKSRPKLHCNGRCAMMKKLKADEKKDTDNPERKSAHKNQIFSSFIINNDMALTVNITTVIAYPILDDDNIFKMPRSCFRPPGMA